MQITPVDLESPAMEAFVDLPWKIYGQEHPWVPPIKASVRAELSSKNLFFTHGKARAFLCMRGSEVVGRIVASTDSALAAGPAVGFFGYFEVINDTAAAAALFQAAESWLRAQGCEEVHGPVNLNIYNGYRAQTAGFKTRPFLGEPRSPEYYAKVLSDCGYAVHATWNSWDLSQPMMAFLKSAASQMVKHFSEQLKPFRVETFNRENIRRDCERLHPLVMEIFKENYGYSAIGLEEYFQVYLPMGALMDPGFPMVLDPSSKLVGFSFGYPDYSDIFREIDGDSSKMGLLHERPRPTTLVLHTFGITEAHRKGGIAHLIGHVIGGVTDNYKQAIGALAKEGGTAYDKAGKPSRSYAVFRKTL